MFFANCLNDDEEKDMLADLTYEALNEALKKTEKEGRNKNGIHFYNEYTLVVGTEIEAKAIAKLFEDLGFYNVTIGYFDPENDMKNGEVDECTGKYFVTYE